MAFCDKVLESILINYSSMSLQFDKESHMAMSELYYIQQKAGRVIPPPKMDYLRKISEEYGFPVGAHASGYLKRICLSTDR